MLPLKVRVLGRHSNHTFTTKGELDEDTLSSSDRTDGG